MTLIVPLEVIVPLDDQRVGLKWIPPYSELSDGYALQVNNEMADMADHKAGLTRAVRLAAKEAERLYKHTHREAEGLKINLDVSSYKPRPREMRNYATRIVAWFIQSAEVRAMSNERIAKKLSTEYGGYKAPANLLTEKLKPWQLDQISPLLSPRGIIPSAKGLNSLSKIKKALIAHAAGNPVTDQLEAFVILNDTHVIVGNRSFLISRHGKYDRIDVGRTKINVASLKLMIS